MGRSIKRLYSQVQRCYGVWFAPGHRIRCTGAGIPIVKSSYIGTGSPDQRGSNLSGGETRPMESNTHE